MGEHPEEALHMQVRLGVKVDAAMNAALTACIRTAPLKWKLTGSLFYSGYKAYNDVLQKMHMKINHQCPVCLNKY